MSSIAASMSASRASPDARTVSTASAGVIPGGSCRPKRPAKIRSVAPPRIRGATANSAVPSTPRATTAATLARSGRRRPSNRLAEGPKRIAF